MDMNLGLEREKVNELLVKSGYEPLMARNIYEGLLITIYLYDTYIPNNKYKEVKNNIFPSFRSRSQFRRLLLFYKRIFCLILQQTDVVIRLTKDMIRQQR